MKIFLFVLSLFLIANCSFAQAINRFKDKVSTPRGNVSLQPVYMESMVDSSYVLGPGDFLDLFLENTYFSAQVNPDGTIAIDECGSVAVGGKTLQEAKKAILKQTSTKFDPKYSFVQLSRLKTFKVSVMGAVNAPGQINIESQTRLSSLFRMAGWFTPSADQENVLLIRNGDSIRVNVDAMIRNGNFEQDYVLLQGDRVYAPYVDVNKTVTLSLPGKSLSLVYVEGRTVHEYYMAGYGDNIENGNFESLKIKFADGTEKRISVSDSRKETVLPGAEIVCINEAGTNEFVYVGGAVAMMGKVPYNPEYKALDYIAASGVTPITGSWDQVRVVRGNRETLDVNVTEDVILPGDYIEIPKSTYESFKDFTMFLASLLTVVSSTFIIYMNYK